jgi:hypothetical protein
VSAGVVWFIDWLLSELRLEKQEASAKTSAVKMIVKGTASLFPFVRWWCGGVGEM